MDYERSVLAVSTREKYSKLWIVGSFRWIGDFEVKTMLYTICYTRKENFKDFIFIASKNIDYFLSFSMM